MKVVVKNEVKKVISLSHFYFWTMQLLVRHFFLLTDYLIFSPHIKYLTCLHSSYFLLILQTN